MKKSIRRRPELELLESMLLLSTAVGATHAPRSTAQVAPVTVALAGTLHASAHLAGHRLTVIGTGSLDPVGPVAFKYSARVDYPSPSATLVSKHGKLILVGDGTPALGAGSGSVHYRVIGGTGSYLGATGAGNASVAFTTLPGGRAALDATFS